MTRQDGRLTDLIGLRYLVQSAARVGYVRLLQQGRRCISHIVTLDGRWLLGNGMGKTGRGTQLEIVNLLHSDVLHSLNSLGTISPDKFSILSLAPKDFTFPLPTDKFVFRSEILIISFNWK